MMFERLPRPAARGIDFAGAAGKLSFVSPGGIPLPQLLHLVFGGELVDPQRTEFRDLGGIDIVGIFPDYASAFAAWKAKAQATVDNAHARYFVAHLHRLTDDELGDGPNDKSG